MRKELWKPNTLQLNRRRERRVGMEASILYVYGDIRVPLNTSSVREVNCCSFSWIESCKSISGVNCIARLSRDKV